MMRAEARNPHPATEVDSPGRGTVAGSPRELTWSDGDRLSRPPTVGGIVEQVGALQVHPNRRLRVGGEGHRRRHILRVRPSTRSRKLPDGVARPFRTRDIGVRLLPFRPFVWCGPARRGAPCFAGSTARAALPRRTHEGSETAAKAISVQLRAIISPDMRQTFKLLVLLPLRC